MAIESQADVQARFDLAVREGVSPCQWIPPEWDDLDTKVTPRRFLDTSKDAGKFGEPKALQARQERMDKGHASDTAPVKAPESPPDDESWTHPFGDTTHIDETEFSKADHENMKSALQGNQDVLRKLNRIVGATSPGMRRLKRIFEWTLYRATVLMENLNNGLEHEDRYETARENYLEFLSDLDDHEPDKGSKVSPRDIANAIAAEGAEGIENKPSNLIANDLKAKITAKLEARLGDRAERRAAHLAKRLGERLAQKTAAEIKNLAALKLDVSKKEFASGYGRSIKWTCIEPVIVDGKIVGTRIVVKWNPHISSSGIAIAH
jgi:hypothetical protein